MAPATRERILAAAVRVLQQRGAAHLTTREVARVAGCAEGSIFKNFRDKAGLLGAVLCEGLPELEALRRSAAEAPTRPVREALVALARAAIDFYAASLPITAVLLTDPTLVARHREAIRAGAPGPQQAHLEVAEYLRAEQERGRLSPTADPRATALLLCGAAQHRALLELVAGPSVLPDDRDAAATAIADTVLSGLAR